MDRASARCSEGHGFKPYWDWDFFLGPTLVLHYFHIYLPSCNFTITHLSLFTTYTLLNPAGGRRSMSCKNSVKWPGSPWVLVAQWIERPLGDRKVMGSNLIGTQIFSRSHARVTLFSNTFTELQFHHHSFNQSNCSLHNWADWIIPGTSRSVLRGRSDQRLAHLGSSCDCVTLVVILSF